MDQPLISRRKDEHLEICANQQVEYRETTTWFEDVRLIHHALPDFGMDDLDTSIDLFGKRLKAPVIIGAMTGGSDSGREFNRHLAAVAQEMGIGFALGSQRAALRHPESVETYQVRDVAPDALVIGNLGLQQARDTDEADLLNLMESTALDALAIHLNPGMELFQAEGDRDFRGGREALSRLVRLSRDRLMVKETGCGISREVGQILREVGVRTVEVAGAGGTSWIRVECLRNPDPVLTDGAWGASPFEEWGLPTAASVVELGSLKLRVIASGGIRHGLEAAKALALGAHAVSVALPVLRAYYQGGVAGVRAYLNRFIREIEVAMLLTGCRDIAALRVHPAVMVGQLGEWVKARDIIR